MGSRVEITMAAKLEELEEKVKRNLEKKMKIINKDINEVKLKQETSPNMEEKIKKAVKGEMDKELENIPKTGNQIQPGKPPHKPWNTVEADSSDGEFENERLGREEEQHSDLQSTGPTDKPQGRTN